MPKSPKQEARALSADERELVAKSRPPALQALTDTQLATLLKRMRERRNRARTVADRQRRELRGKTRARGATPSKADEGSRLKLSVLTTALQRLDAETQRRRRAKAKTSLVASARKALTLKQKAGRAAAPSTTRSANAGLRGKARVTAQNHVPRSTRGRVRKQVARAQAKRDARPR
jgi:hypothetical protein